MGMIVLFGALAAVYGAPSRASAQASASVTLDQFRPGVTAEDGFVVNRPDDRGDGQFGASLTFGYALDPLVYEATRGSVESERYAVVAHQLAAHATFSYGLFDRVVFYAGLPVNLVMSGVDDPEPPIQAADGAGLGDAWLGGRVRLLGARDDAFALALQASLSLPSARWTNDAMRYSGDPGVIVHPELLAELRTGGLRFTANVGGRLRAVDRSDVATLVISHELTLGAAVSAPLWKNDAGASLSAHLEFFGATTVADAFARETSPFEMLFGLRAQPTCGVHLGLAGGTGLSRGYGAPDFRGVLSVGYAASTCDVAPVEEAAPEIGDADGDGLRDDADRCANEPEDVDDFEDADGCPDLDNDGDGVPDANDGAPMEPEDRDGVEDADGVPDLDDDRDGVPDASDACRNEPEDRDGFQDADGCPETDNDRDTVLDPTDRCPLAPGRPEDGGCPRTVRLDIDTGTIVILQKVEFATNRDVILDRSFPILDEVRAILAANEQITRIRIEGHTDDRGADAANLDLSTRRAASVVRWLVEHAIAGVRMEGWGCGELHPTASNGNDEGRQANRRVEFHIVDPAPPNGSRNLEGCVRAY
jgi:outer membrane protein OmpA-like peptidoglycan-associated protein